MPVYTPGNVTNQVKSGHAPGFSIKELKIAASEKEI
jgi:hypothetical protein